MWRDFGDTEDNSLYARLGISVAEIALFFQHESLSTWEPHVWPFWVLEIRVFVPILEMNKLET